LKGEATFKAEATLLNKLSSCRRRLKSSFFSAELDTAFRALLSRAFVVFFKDLLKFTTSPEVGAKKVNKHHTVMVKAPCI
jgi:hypothetical protein